MDDFCLTIIGSGAALPMHGRHPSAQVVQYGDLCCLIDCGEGTQERLKPAGIRAFRINVILISHLHGDHIFGLPGLMSSLTHLNRTEKLTIYGPEGLKGLLESIMGYTEMKISYPLEIIEHKPEGLTRLIIRDHIEILTFPLYHRISCNGYMLREINPHVRLKKEMVHAYQLSPEQIHAIKSGHEIDCRGVKVPPGTFFEEPIEPVTYAYCSDTHFDLRLLPVLRGVKILYYETTFMNDKADLARQTGHSTAGEAGRIASGAGVSCLMTGHYSSRYTEIEPLIKEAEVHFPFVIKAEEGKKYNLRQLTKGLSA